MSPDPPHLVLLGLMGVGKTTVGRALAERLGRPLSDSDEVITRRCGATVRELDERLGTAGMHRLEAEHLLDALADPEPSVICAAASVIEDDACRRALRAPEAFAVWLRGTAHLLAGRFAAGPHRPVFGPDAEDVFSHQLADRSRRFAAVADLQVEVEHRPVSDIVEEVLRALGRATV